MPPELLFQRRRTNPLVSAALVGSPNLTLAFPGNRRFADVYKYCSPTRSSFLSGRLPMHVNQNNACNDALSASGIDLRMTLLPQKLKEAGWSTAMVGKYVPASRT